MKELTDTLQHRGAMTAYLIDPAWKGSFPYDWPRERWPIVRPLFRKCNQITIAGQLYSYNNGFKFTYIGGGTGTGIPISTDKVLQAEVQRFEVTGMQYQSGQIDAFAEIAPDTGNMTWAEWGVFMDDATAQANTGTLYSHLLQLYTKTFGDTVLLDYTLSEVLT